jgi:RNA polymerase sigma-70 factor (ECF subfamily)
VLHGALLEQAPWIRALAHSLVRDPHTADDLVQETWVSMLEHRPEAGNSLRGWVTTVLRNHLGKLRRGEGRRRGREQAASRPESTPAVLDVVQRAATHKSLVEAVLALEEPYRETILMRYFEQLSYAEIARRTGVAEATVNSRITRGLARLRERLDREHGGRENLLAALIPICTAVRPEAAAAAATGASVLMSTPFQISVAAALSIASVVSVWQFTGAAAPSTSAAAARPAAGDPAIRAAELAIPRPLERGTVEPVRSEPAPLAAETLAPTADDDWVANLSQDLRSARRSRSCA